MISLVRPGADDIGYWTERQVAYAVTRGTPDGQEEIAVCEHPGGPAWDRLAHRHDPKGTR